MFLTNNSPDICALTLCIVLGKTNLFWVAWKCKTGKWRPNSGVENDGPGKWRTEFEQYTEILVHNVSGSVNFYSELEV